jgi:hypothetical protein
MLLGTLGGVAAAGAGIVLTGQAAGAEGSRTPNLATNPPLLGVSASASVAGVEGECTAAGVGIRGYVATRVRQDNRG